jgi:hypothetical protein
MSPHREASDRRVATRRQPTLGTVYEMKSGEPGSSHVGLVWNLSSSGISLLLHQPVQPGSKMQGELTTMHNRGKLALSAQVVHTYKLSTGDYFVGARLSTPLSDEQMQPFLA